MRLCRPALTPAMLTTDRHQRNPNRRHVEGQTKRDHDTARLEGIALRCSRRHDRTFQIGIERRPETLANRIRLLQDFVQRAG